MNIKKQKAQKGVSQKVNWLDSPKGFIKILN